MPHSTFDGFDLPPKLAQALARIHFKTPTPIQAQTIPLALQGRDVLGSAQTGTGKTGAFGIPVIAGLMKNPEAAALIMTPTRELATQVMKAIEPMIPTADIRTAVLIGGEAMPRQFSQLRHNPRLIVGTPGRINDHLERGTLKLGNVRFLVLDETDRMLDMGFGIQIERIVQHMPKERQTLLFSATMPANINKLSGKYMNDPARVAVGSTGTPVAKIKQEVITVTDHEKYDRLLEQLEARKGSIIIFVKTKYGTEKLADRINKAGHRSDAIHGDLQQRRRERVISNFRDSKFRILVATDVAARGLDIPHIAHVINYDMPQAPEDYIHRIGRTARAGAEGEALSFVGSADRGKWNAIQRLMNGEDPNVPQARSGGGARRGFGGGGGRGRSSEGAADRGGRKPFWKKDGARTSGDKPAGERSFSDRPRSDRPRSDRSSSDRPTSDRAASDRPRSFRSDDKPRERSEHKPYGDKPRDHKTGEHKPHDYKPRDDAGGRGDRRDDKPRTYKPRDDKPRDYKPRDDKPREYKPRDGEARDHHRSRDAKPAAAGAAQEWRPRGAKPFGKKPFGGKPSGGKPAGSKPYAGKKFGAKPHRKAAD